MSALKPTADEFDCALVLEATETPFVLVPELLAAAQGDPPRAFGRSLRTMHRELLRPVETASAQAHLSHAGEVPPYPRFFDSPQHDLVQVTSNGVEWFLAVVQIQPRPLNAYVLIAVLRDEVGAIGPAAESFLGELAWRAGRLFP